MKKLATGLVGLVGLATLLLILSGCTKKPEATKHSSSKESVKTSQTSTNNSKPKVTLTTKELVATIYIESYMAQHSTKDIPTAVNEILKQPEFMITTPLNNTFLANEHIVLVGGDLGTTITITDDKIHVQSYNGNEQFSDKYYSAKELTSKYTTHVDLLKKVVTLSDKHVAERNSLTNEELALSAYVKNYVTTNTEISSFLSEGLSKDFSVGLQDNSYHFSQGTGSSSEEITVSDNRVTCIVHNGATQTDTVNFTKEELSKLFLQYKQQLDNLLSIGKDNYTKFVDSQTTATSSTVDKTKLSEEQTKTWVKNYLLQSGDIDKTTFDEFTSIGTSLDDENCLLLSPRGRSKGNTTNDSSLGYFRINSDGELQKQNLSEVDGYGDWKTVSTTYLGSE